MLLTGHQQFPPSKMQLVLSMSQNCCLDTSRSVHSSRECRVWLDSVIHKHVLGPQGLAAWRADASRQGPEEALGALATQGQVSEPRRSVSGPSRKRQEHFCQKNLSCGMCFHCGENVVDRKTHWAWSHPIRN